MRLRHGGGAGVDALKRDIAETGRRARIREAVVEFLNDLDPDLISRGISPELRNELRRRGVAIGLPPPPKAHHPKRRGLYLVE